MSEMYLYGAAVQGIQGFIFQTNKLREIVGASELVEEICTVKFQDLFKQVGVSYVEDDCVLHAAGNIKYIFKSESDCSKVVREFPKTIYEFAPGITVSQAVVKYDGINFECAVNELENNLRTQRNRPIRSATLGLMGIERSRYTGLPVVLKKDNEYIDAATLSKLYEDSFGERKRTTKILCEKAFGKQEVFDEQIAYDIEDITKCNDWIAIIHADGNGLGQVVQAIGTDKVKFKEFSEKLDDATRESAIAAYNAVRERFTEDKIIPIRPIVLGGDDFTTICRGDMALDYVASFIDNFEKRTVFVKDFKSEILKFDHLTACAGIAYIKSSFPFYYGYNLAEDLCSEAKKDAKADVNEGELAKSCLMFHKVQDSFTEDFSAIAKRELSPRENISFQFGPYYINEAKAGRWTVSELNKYVNQLLGKEGNAVKSHLRQWMSLLHDNPEMAKQKLLRLKSMTTMKDYVENVTKATTRKKEKKDVHVFPVYDILAIHTINNQMTKEVEQ